MPQHQAGVNNLHIDEACLCRGRLDAINRVERFTLAKEMAWQVEMAKRAVYAAVRAHTYAGQGAVGLVDYASQVRRVWREQIKRHTATLRAHFAAVACGMADHRGDTFVEFRSALWQQAKH